MKHRSFVVAIAASLLVLVGLSSCMPPALDLPAPSAPVLSAPTVTNERRPTWTWTASEYADAYLVQFSSMPGTWTRVGVLPRAWTPAFDLTDGNHSLFVKAVNAEGEESSFDVRTVKVDTLSPAAPSVSGPVSPTTDSTPTWTWSASSDATTFRCQLGAESAAGWTVQATKVYTPKALADGTYTLFVQAGDQAGNWSASTPSTVAIEGGIPATRLRLVASNLTSGTNQDYTGMEGIRILEGIDPDVVMVQEFNYKSNADVDFQEMANLIIYRAATGGAGGEQAFWYREGKGGVGSAGTIPNGIVSKYPILSAGEWDDPYMTDRDFAWARLDVPGDVDLWAVSVHLKASSAETDKQKRTDEATSLKALIATNVPAAAYLVVAGDFNTYSSDTAVEPCLSVLDDFVIVAMPFPADVSDDSDTNSGRSSPYDRVLADSDLDAIEVPVEIGAAIFANGAVIDTRVYSPIDDISPALATDSAALNMQHMAVVRDFALP